MLPIPCRCHTDTSCRMAKEARQSECDDNRLGSPLRVSGLTNSVPKGSQNDHSAGSARQVPVRVTNLLSCGDSPDESLDLIMNPIRLSLQRHLQRPLPRARFLESAAQIQRIRATPGTGQTSKWHWNTKKRHQRPQAPCASAFAGHAPIPRPERHDGLPQQILLPANALTSANEQPSIQSRLVHSLGDRRHCMAIVATTFVPVDIYPHGERLRDYALFVQGVVTTVAIGAGAYVADRRFQIFRTFQPHLTIATELHIDSSVRATYILRSDRMVLHNRSRVKTDLRRGFVSLMASRARVG